MKNHICCLCILVLTACVSEPKSESKFVKNRYLSQTEVGIREILGEPSLIDEGLAKRIGNDDWLFELKGKVRKNDLVRKYTYFRGEHSPQIWIWFTRNEGM